MFDSHGFMFAVNDGCAPAVAERRRCGTIGPLTATKANVGKKEQGVVKARS